MYFFFLLLIILGPTFIKCSCVEENVHVPQLKKEKKFDVVNLCIYHFMFYCEEVEIIWIIIWAASWKNQRFAYAKTKTQISFAV